MGEYTYVRGEIIPLSPQESAYKKYLELLGQGISMAKINSILVSLGIHTNRYWLPGINESYNARYATVNMTEKMIGIESTQIDLVRRQRYFPSYLHRHTYFEVILVLSGHVQNIIEGVSIDLTAGDICLIPPYVRHMISANGDDSIVLNLPISRELIKNFFMKQLKTTSSLYCFLNDSVFKALKSGYFLCHISQDGVVDECFDTLMRIENQDRGLSNRLLLLKSITMLLFLRISENFAGACEYHNTAYNTSNKVSEILLYLQTSYRSVTLSSTAMHFSYSPSYLSHMLKKETGSTFSVLLENIRITQSCFFLLDTDLSPQEISKIVGYRSSTYFNRLFIRTIGIHPLQFRSSMKISHTYGGRSTE